MSEDTFILYRVEAAPRVYAYREQNREITVNFSLYPVISASTVGDSSEVRYNFVSADLNPERWVYFPHTLGTTVDVSVFMPTDQGAVEIVPDQVTYELNKVGINLAQYGNITGVWSILIEI